MTNFQSLPKVKNACKCTDFNKIQGQTLTFCIELLYQISWQSE